MTAKPDHQPTLESTDMDDVSSSVRCHYEPQAAVASLVDAVERALATLGSRPLTSAQLAGLDQFHSRIHNHLQLRRHRLTASEHRAARGMPSAHGARSSSLCLPHNDHALR